MNHEANTKDSKEVIYIENPTVSKVKVLPLQENDIPKNITDDIGKYQVENNCNKIDLKPKPRRDKRGK